VNRLLAITAIVGMLVGLPHRAKAEDLPPTCDATNLHPIPATHTIPAYPSTAIQTAESGTTLVRAIIGPDGTPVDVSVQDTSGFADLDATAVDWIKRTWRWAPLPAECPTIEEHVRVTWSPGTAATARYDTSADSNKRFLADYAARPDVKKLPDGLMYRVLKAGDGPKVQKNSDVATVYYKGALINGKVFDQTKPEEPVPLQVGAVIPGWTEALKLMKTGDTWELVIPADLGYGSDGMGDVIPPNQTLVFVMKLTKVEYGF